MKERCCKNILLYNASASKKWPPFLMVALDIELVRLLYNFIPILWGQLLRNMILCTVIYRAILKKKLSKEDADGWHRVSEVETVLGSSGQDLPGRDQVGGLCCRTGECLIYWYIHRWCGKGLIIKQITGSYLRSSLPLVSLETLFLVNFLNCINIKLWLWIRKNRRYLKSSIYTFRVTFASHG